MHHHHHIDEFSVTDVRHTLAEIGRVLVARKWSFLFPFCIMASLACIASLYVPRQYSAVTVIKRERDPVFASMKKKNWNQPYDEIRTRTTADLTDMNTIRAVLERANLPVGAERFPDGSLTPAGEASLTALATRISNGLSVKSLEYSESRDIIQITLTMRDPSRVTEILQLIRENYIEHARVRTATVLENVHKYLKAETTQCEAELARVQRRIRELETKHPGINPMEPDALGSERTALMIERLDIRRRLDEATARQRQLESRKAMIGGRGEVADGTGADLVEESNPRYAELLNEIKTLEEKLVVCRTRKAMTEAHPEVRGTRALLEERTAELSATPRIVMAPRRHDTHRAGSPAARADLDYQISETVSTIATLKDRSDIVETRLAEIEAARVFAIEQRPVLTELTEQARRLETNLAQWRKDLMPIENAMNLEGAGRSVHLVTVKEAPTSIKPASPDGMLVVLICFGIGAAAGALTVVVVELCDRSYRTVKQVTTSLGIPVIESIDEIITSAALRRRIFRGMLVMPTLGILFLIITSFAGLMAYYSLEKPEEYARLRGRAAQVESIALGRG